MTPRNQHVRRRRGARPVRRRFGEGMWGPLRALCLMMLILAALGGAGFGGYHLWKFTHSDFFRLREITVEGVSPAIESEMRALMVDLSERGLTLFQISPRVVRSRLLQHPRLEPESISVRRRWPDALEVRAQERRPFATVAGSRLMLVDREGWVIEQSPRAVMAENLPVLSGLDASVLVYGQRMTDPDAHRLLDWLAAIEFHSPRMHRDLSELHIDPTGDVTAHLMGETVVRLGTRPPEEQLPVLLTFTREIESDLTELALLDLRLDDHLVYRRRDIGLSASR
ncbi:FtsQ-type POTRA domain-containing protein [Candidatus Sumerlaeota bacterium]|nr:FtsQ-type POTRA domain-containing protein [Candidatus Sumerlaeota bacterium]